MTITLPDELRDELEAETRRQGYPSIDVYVHMMYQRAKSYAGPMGAYVLDDLPDTTPEEVEAFRKRLPDLIQAGLDSGPAIQVTPEFWDNLRQEIAERAAASTGHGAEK